MSKILFLDEKPGPLDQWRAIVLYGRNVASYKFALAESLLKLGAEEREFVRLDELARPFSDAIRRHLQLEDKQGTQSRSRFLDACRQSNKGHMGAEQLIDATVKLGFQNVIDAFHRVASNDVPNRFFLDERSGKQSGIRILPELISSSRSPHALAIAEENEARWRLVETAWSLEVPVNVVQVELDPLSERLVVQDRDRRKSITGVRDALSGYQKGACFYCRAPISVDAGSVWCADVDHVLPHALGHLMAPHSADGAWNLALACKTCNRGSNGKFDRLPSLRFLESLSRRNEYYIQSHHPLRETLINQTGRTPAARRTFLQDKWRAVRAARPGTPWEPRDTLTSKDL